MALQDLLTIAQEKKKIGLSEERVRAIIPAARQYVAFWREYPDLMIDFMQKGVDGEIPKEGLHFYFYQRVFIRAAMRFRYCYAVFPRAYSKSFLSIIVLICRSILFPGAKLFVASGGKRKIIFKNFYKRYKRERKKYSYSI